MQTVGVILILSACLLIDRAYKERSMHGVVVLGELCSFFGHIKNRLALGVRPLSVLVRGLEAPELKKLGFLGALAAGDVPIDAYRGIKGELYLSSGTSALIEDFFNFATRGTVNGVEKSCAEILSVLNEEYKMKKEDVTVKCRLVRVVLLSIGLGLAVTVI